MKQEKPTLPGGLSTDTSLVGQPDGSTRFVLNGVNETDEGDKGFIANEESNEPCYTIPTGFIPIGKVYVGEQKHVIFFASDAGDSIIAVADRECNLIIEVDDSNQDAKLGFSVTHQIDATFRLRRGCERVVYFVTPLPMIYNLEKPEEFKDETGDWSPAKFGLAKRYASIPEFVALDVFDDGGQMRAGKYNVAIQYLDEDFNPTEWITSTEGVNIYNDSFTNQWRDIRGFSMLSREWRKDDLVPSTKSLRVTLDQDSLDKDFPFYRLAFIESSNGDGVINSVKYTLPISISNFIFTYTGKNYESEGTVEEIALFNNIIESADSIEQIENRLTLGNTKGKELNFCSLQKYASKISADVKLRKVFLNALTLTNSKQPAFEFNGGAGYMPGEIYSFAIVYIFDDNSTSPAYHIPGKSHIPDATTVYSYEEDVDGNRLTYPMSTTDNESADNTYTDNNACVTGDYWGIDNEGTSLKDQKVRHHRFPLRTDINVPFVEEEAAEVITTFYKKIKITAKTPPAPNNCFTVPFTCPDPLPPGCVDVEAPPFQFRIEYVVDGITQEYVGDIDPSLYITGDDSCYEDYITVQYTGNILGEIISITSVEEEAVLLAGTAAGLVYNTTSPSPKNLLYTVEITNEVAATQEKLYSANIFGIKFSNIEIPSDVDTNGHKIIGYYIVRQERIEEERTILDSAILSSTMKNANFVSHGHLMPEVSDTQIKKDVISLINPEFKFNQKKYTGFTKIIQQGRFDRVQAIHSRSKTEDVLDGTGYVDGKHKEGEKGNPEDGWTLQIKTRDNVLKFIPEHEYDLLPEDIKQLFYLAALEDKLVLDKDDNGIDVFNLAADNRVGIITLEADFEHPIVNSVPYVYLYRRNANPYYNFRSAPYYKENQNPVYFEPSLNSSTDIFNGDSYITPLRYVNSLYYDMRFKKRAGKTSAWSYIAAAVLVVVAVVVAIFSFGAGAAGSIALIGLAAGLVGAASALAISGVKQDAWNRAYSELYDKGLRETIMDDYLQYDGDCTDINNDECYGYVKNPEDDEIQWAGDCLNLWFEGAINMSLRVGATDNTPDFLNAPGNEELGFTGGDWDREYFGIHSVGLPKVGPTTTLDFHMLKKLTYLDDKRGGGKAYVGIALAEIYELNPDYHRRNKQKFYFHLGLEYDCCSDCFETFPQRVHASEQAFQEELSDNYRVFLPNNYIDIEGNSGVITDLFRFYDALYVHTEEALWKLVPDIQERVTGDIVSFIGTGSFFAIPPKKIVDDANSSAGNQHKWGRTKTKYGVLFPCHKEKKWYLFPGDKLQPISDARMMSYFKEAMNFQVDETFFKLNGVQYPYRDNPSNPLGTGYLSTYDTKKERLIVTKKDFEITNAPTTPYDICTEGGDTVIFNNPSQIISDMEADGFIYAGMEDCRMKFVKTTYTTTEETRTITKTFSDEAEIWAFYDTTASFTPAQIVELKAAVQAWYDALVLEGHTGLLHQTDDATERWLNYPSLVTPGGSVVVLTFVNESNPSYHTGTTFDGTVDAPTATYISDYNNFVTNVFPDFDYFAAINYPIKTSNIVDEGFNFIQSAIAAIYGRDMTTQEVDDLEINTAFSGAQWNLLKSSLLNNPYKTVLDPNGDPGLLQYNWKGKSNKNDLGTIATEDCPASSAIISPCQFAVDVNELLAEMVTTEEITVSVTTPVTEVEYVEGTPFVPVLELSGHTLSYSLKDSLWVSWHSYIPDFYLHDQERFYSWKNGLTSIYRHNRRHHYQTFYGQRGAFIVEFVDVSNPLMTKIWDALTMQTEAKQWDPITEEYVDKRYVTFNKILVYNSHQISGVLNMLSKTEDTDYLLDQIVNSASVITIDRDERDWHINELRDHRVDYNIPMFIKAIASLQGDYFIDKKVNAVGVNLFKDWTQLESFRDKYLVVRLIFDNFDTTRLIMNFTLQDVKPSER